MMLSIEDLKDLVVFSRQHKVKSLKIGDVIIEMSDYGFIEDVSKPIEVPPEEILTSNKNWVDDVQQPSPEEDEELLFHSSKG